MSSEAIRIESETLNALRERSTQSGERIVRLAQRAPERGENALENERRLLG